MSRAWLRSPAHLLLLEDNLVEEELQVLIGIVDAQLLKAVELFKAKRGTPVLKEAAVATGLC